MSALARDDANASFFFLGSGALYGIASEGMLKLKEMSLTGSEAYHAMEFRHGPMSMCDESAAVVALVSPERAALEEAVLRDISSFGARLVTIGVEGHHQVPGDVPSWATTGPLPAAPSAAGPRTRPAQRLGPRQTSTPDRSHSPGRVARPVLKEEEP